MWGGRCSPRRGTCRWRMAPGAHLEWSREPPGCLLWEVSLAPSRWVRAPPPQCRVDWALPCGVVALRA